MSSVPAKRAQGSSVVHGAGVCLLSMCSVQLGAGIARGLFDRVPSASVVMLRQAGAALLLFAWQRPRVRGRSSRDWFEIVLFGSVFAGMNLSFYAAIDRLPLGVAVTIELLGPLGVAVAKSRRRSEFVVVGLALAGVLALSRGGDGIEAAGLMFALLAAVGWGSYIVLSQRAGRESQSFDRLAISLAVAAALTAPIGLRAGTDLAETPVLTTAAAVAVLSAFLPFTLDMTALRMLPQRLFGLLQCLSPVIAGLAGRAVLGQQLHASEVVGMALVVLAAVLSVGQNLNDSG